jgi:hypothetical protein
MKFKVGDRVILPKTKENIRYDSCFFPVWGGQEGNIVGTIKSVFTYSGRCVARVAWDTKYGNTFHIEEIEHCKMEMIEEIFRD